MHSAGCTKVGGLHPRVQWSSGALACSLCPSSTCRGSTGMLRQASSLGHRPRRKARPVFRTPHLHTYGLLKDGLRRAVIPMHGSKYEFAPVGAVYETSSVRHVLVGDVDKKASIHTGGGPGPTCSPSVYGYSGYIFRFCNTKTR